MSDLEGRLAKLSPEKRKLLERLAGRQAASAVKEAPEAKLQAEEFSFDEYGLSTKHDVARFYDIVSGQLNASAFAEFSY